MSEVSLFNVALKRSRRYPEFGFGKNRKKYRRSHFELLIPTITERIRKQSPKGGYNESIRFKTLQKD